MVKSYIICTDVHNTVREKEDINNNTNKYADTSRVSVGGTAPQTRGEDHPTSLRMVLGGLSSEVKLASHLNLVPRVRISETTLPIPSWYVCRSRVEGSTDVGFDICSFMFVFLFH
jgi:hypothetical protein